MTAYFQGMWRCRYFWLSLVKMDLRARYRGSVFGLGWSLLHPVAMTIIFTTIFCRLFHQDPRSYAPFVLTGLAFWSFLLQSTLQGCDAFFRGESYIRQHPVPMAIYPLRTILGLGFHLLVAMSLAVVLTTATHRVLAPIDLLSLIPSLFLLVLFGWALAILGGLAQVYFRDTRHLAEIVFQILFYMTPIFYNARVLDGTAVAALLHWNPFIPFLDLLRIPLLYGIIPDPSVPRPEVLPALPMLYAKACLVVTMALGLAGYALSRLERKLIFRL
jgi:ABC-type polysaccharide/polyol phosphate export permease